MARGRNSKATKKFEKNHLGKAIENRKIQKKNRERYGKNKLKNGANKAAAGEIGQKDHEKKTPIAAKKGDLFDNMTMDEFLATPAENMMQIDPPQYTQEDGEETGKGDEMERSHKEGLEGLKEKDPSFYEFLKQNDRELLEFDPDELIEDDEDDEEAPVEGGLTKEILARWEKALLEGKSLSALKKILIAVRNAAANVTGEEPQHGNSKYVLTDPEAFDRLLLIAFQQTPEILRHHVPLVTNEKTGKVQVPSQNKHLTQISPLLKSLFQSTLVLLPNLSSPPTTLLVLSQTEKLIPYITGFRKLIKQLVTAILDIWSRTVRTSDDGDDDEEKDKAEEQDSVKVAAFLWIRKVMSLGDPSLRELCLKTSYASFVKNSRVTTSRTLPHLNFLKNSLSELYGLNPQSSYQNAFTYIRQLAIHLRNAMTAKTPETTRIVYCWQYIHSLDFFSRMLSQHVGQNKSSPLHPLIYPVIQVALGTIKLNPSSQYFPLRFQVVESLLRLSRQTGVYIPLAPTLMEPLDSTIMKISKMKKTETMLKPFDFEITLRVSPNYLTGPSSRVYRDQIALRMVDLLAQFFDLHAMSPAFPELVLTPTMILKKWVKKHGGDCGGKVRHALADLVEKLDAHAKWVEQKRQGMGFDPERLADVQVPGDQDEGPLRKWIQKQKS